MAACGALMYHDHVQVDDAKPSTLAPTASVPQIGPQHDSSPEQELYTFFLLCQFLADKRDFLTV